MLTIALLLAFQDSPSAGGGFRAETTRVLHDWRGDAAGEQLGWVARNAGDVDGDGREDVIASAPFRVIEGGPAGRVLVWSGADGELLFELVGLEPGGQFGMYVCETGDLNADGIGDLAVAAPQMGPGVVLFHSGADGAELGALEGEREGDAFGSALGSGAWIGSTRFVVGAKDAGAGRRGRVYVYDLTLETREPRFVFDAEPTGVDLGRFFVSVLGDVDGDGEPDVYAADFADGANSLAGRSGGRFYVHSGADGARLFARGAFAPGQGLGIGDARAGDQNGDGRADLIVGAWTHGDDGAGAAYLLSGADLSLLAFYESGVAGEAMGFDATSLADLDGDGRRELLLTGAYHPEAGAQTGRVVVLSSRSR